MRISQTENQIFEIFDKQQKNQNNQKLKIIKKCEKSTSVREICQLQSKIHQKLFKKSDIFD